MLLAVGPFGLGPLELVVILLVLVMIFGATRLADLGGSLGKGIREFKRNVKEDEKEEEAPSPVASASTTPVATPNGADTIAAIKCPNCGTLNVAAAKHCNECGAALTAPVA